MSLNLGPTINLSGSYNTQRNQLNFSGLTYTTVGSTFTATPTTYNGGDYYLSLTNVQAGTYASLIVGNYIVGTGIPNGSKIVAIITTNSGAGTGTYQMSCSQPQALGAVSNCSAATASLQNYGQVVATAPIFTGSAFRGQLDFNVPATNKTSLIMSLTNGNVGIGGKPNPLATLDVSGTMTILNGNLAIGQAYTDPGITLDVSGATSITNGNLAIGKLIAAPRLALDVSGTMSVINGNLAIGVNNQIAGPGYALDVGGIINTNSGINYSYTTVPTFTSSQIGYSIAGSQLSLTLATNPNYKSHYSIALPSDGVYLINWSLIPTWTAITTAGFFIVVINSTLDSGSNILAPSGNSQYIFLPVTSSATGLSNTGSFILRNTAGARTIYASATVFTAVINTPALGSSSFFQATRIA